MQHIAAIRSLRLLPASRTSLLPLLRASSASATTTAARTADTALHSEDPQRDDAEEAAKAAAAEEEKKKEGRKEEEDMEPPHHLSDNIPPFAPSPKLESHEVVPPGPPSFQQKRRLSHQPDPTAVLTSVPCVGADGTPLGREAGVGLQDQRRYEQEEQQQQEEDYKAYYQHRKPSPLSEIKFVDTRKPITRATDGGASDDVEWDIGRGVMVKETVDEALARAEAMFRERAMAGDPDLPHSRVLRRMLGVGESELR